MLLCKGKALEFECVSVIALVTPISYIGLNTSFALGIPSAIYVEPKTVTFSLALTICHI
jgi:hypothetical protein